MFTTDFLKHYPTPWRTGDASSPEVVDCHGDNVIFFEGDTPEDREFWDNVVTAVNQAGDRTVVTNAIGIGMAIAAGIVMNCWRDEVAASEILGAAGLRTVADMRAIGVDRYDIRLCVPVLKRFREQARSAAA